MTAGSVGESKARLELASRMVEEAAGMSKQAANDYEKVATALQATAQHVASALGKLFGSTDAVKFALDNVHGSHEIVDDVAPEVETRVRGSQLDDLKTAGQKLQNEADATKKEEGEVADVLAALRKAYKWLIEIDESLKKATQTSSTTLAEGAKQTSGNLTTASKDLFDIANTF
jgi:hypothetical protein